MLLEVRDLTLGYDAQIVAEHVDFKVDEGDYLCVVGENGSGKTTLMRTLLGLIRPLKGEIVRSDELKRSGIGYLPQQTLLQRDFPATVEEIVLSGFQNRCADGSPRGIFRPFYGREEKRIAREQMEHMGIAQFAKRSYRELSGGQQQRVLLSRALCAAGKILLLDEPVTGLDPTASRELYRCISDLNKEGTAIIMISHDIQEAVPYASHVLHMGKKIFFGTREEYEESRIGRLFLAEEETEAEKE